MTEWLCGRTRHSNGGGCAGLNCASTRFVRRVFKSVKLSPLPSSITAPQSSAVAIHFRISINSPRCARVATTPRRGPSRWARIGYATAVMCSVTHSIPIIRGTGAATDREKQSTKVATQFGSTGRTGRNSRSQGGYTPIEKAGGHPAGFGGSGGRMSANISQSCSSVGASGSRGFVSMLSRQKPDSLSVTAGRTKS